MKKKIFIVLLLFCSVLISAQKVIEKPSYEVSKSGIHHIAKIEINKTETKIHIHNTFLPKWWVMFDKDIFIKDYKTDKKYQIISIENHKFKEKIWMPKSGENTVVLIFSPLDEGVEKLDYHNLIYGVSLNKTQSNIANNIELPTEVSKWFSSELAKVTKKPVTAFNSPDFFNKGKAKLIGYIKGYDTRLDFSTGMIYMGSYITREENPIVIQIYPDGRFEAEIPLTNPSYTWLRFKNHSINFYLEPEQTLAMVIDWEEFLLADRYRNKRYQFNKIEFKGALSKINKDLMGFNPKEFNYKKLKKRIKKETPEVFKEKETAFYKKNEELLNKYIVENNIDNKTQAILKKDNLLIYTTILFDFASNRKYEAKKDTLNLILKTPVRDSYYNFIESIDFNDTSLLVPEKFSTFVNRFEYCKPMLIYPKGKSFKPKKDFLEYLKEEKVVLTANDKKLQEASKNKRFKSKGEYDKHFEKCSDTYKNALNSYKEIYVDPHLKKANSEINAMEKWRLRDSVVKNTFNKDKNLVCDIVKIRALGFDIKRSNSQNAYKYWSELKQEIKDPFLIEQGERIVYKNFSIKKSQTNTSLDNNRSTKKITLKASVTKLPKGKATDVFKKITDSFKGKILFVDFWATTCGPCVGSIKRMKETRKKYENNKDFDFVFITDERASPEKSYNKFVAEQELTNTFRLSLDDFNYLRQLFKFNGIPKYVVIDKNGDVINDDFHMYQFNSLLDDIIEKHK